MHSWKKSTQKNYSSILRQWLSVCSEQGCNSDEPTVTSVLSFVTSLYERGIGYSQINKARSALSALCPDVQIGKLPLISWFVHGVKNLRNPQPKYPFLWDAKEVLLYLANWKVTSSSPLKDISVKLTTVLACVSAQRLHMLTLLDARYIQFQSSRICMYIFSDLKVPRAQCYFIMVLPSPSDIDHLGTVELRQIYLEKTEQFCRHGHHRLLLSWHPPHNPVTTDTLACWIRQVMQDLGINVHVFGAHSVRGASSSFALEHNESIDSVLTVGDWSSLWTFNKHYNRMHKSLPSNELSTTITACGLHDSI